MSQVVVQECGVGIDDRRAALSQQPTGAQVVRRSQRGMVSAEWAVGLIAAIAIAGVLLAVVTNGSIREGLLRFILAVINAFSDKL